MALDTLSFRFGTETDWTKAGLLGKGPVRITAKTAKV
jgi:hypothetical protein